MQDSTPALPHWAFQVLQTLVTFGAGGLIVKLITLYQNRKKPLAEVHESEARTAKITAQSNAVNVTSALRLIERLDVALAEIDRIRADRNELSTRVDLQEIELRERDRQVEKMNAIMKIKGIKLSDFDEG